jgi:DNA-binding IclR family transcriptional regulator
MIEDKMTAIEKAVYILNILSKEPFAYKVTDVSAMSGINRTTVHRILNTLTDSGWVILDRELNKFKIGPMLYHMGQAYLAGNNYESKLVEILGRLSQQTEESVGYAARDGERVISLYEMEIYQPLKMNYRAGTFYPINKGSYGKCLMAYYDEQRVNQLVRSQKYEKTGPNTLTDPEDILAEYRKIREQGYVISDEEVAPLIVGGGVPVFNQKGKVDTCIAIAFVKNDGYEQKIADAIKILQDGAKEISLYVP